MAQGEFCSLQQGVFLSSLRLVVALLGLLGMTPLEAEEAFFNVYDTVFADIGATRETRTLRLRTSLNKLLESRNLSESVRICDSSLDHGCKV
jgi:hypothetical protein